MKDLLSRTKVVVRHLPPSLPQSDLFQQIDDRFNGRYNWSYFRPGKTSQKYQRYSRAYIDFKRPEDVFEFAEFFDGHVFVNEKGAQHKAVVEYAPSQRVPKLSIKRDGREGTILKDPDYLEFLKIIAKPVEHLPSAEIQLERKEAEQAVATKEAPIITPLMEYIRQKRAAGSGTRGSLVVGKVSRRGAPASPSKHRSSGSKRLSEKKKYILKDNTKNTNRKAKSTFITVPKRENQPATSSGKEASENEIGSVSAIPVIADSGKKKILLLKGKERDISTVPDTMPQQQGVLSEGNSAASAGPKQNQRREASGRLFRSILINNESRQSQTSSGVQPQHKIRILNSENAKQFPRSSNERSVVNGNVSHNDLNSLSSEVDRKRAAETEDKFTKRDLHCMTDVTERQDKHMRNKDRSDRGVWAPLCHADALYASDEHTSSIALNHTPLPSETVEGSRKHFGRRASNHSLKDDGSQNSSEGKPSKRGGTAHGPHEKQIWVQKPSSSGS